MSHSHTQGGVQYSTHVRNSTYRSIPTSDHVVLKVERGLAKRPRLQCYTAHDSNPESGLKRKVYWLLLYRSDLEGGRRGGGEGGG